MPDYGVRLTPCDQAGRSLQVYLDLSHTPYPPGLLPGNTLLLSGFQRRLSRTGSVYCTYLPVSSITVVSLGDTSSAQPPLPAPIMHLGEWALSSKQRGAVGQVKGHVLIRPQPPPTTTPEPRSTDPQLPAFSTKCYEIDQL
ncbi:CST complex subunit CTC1-like [Astatotilapia calliptera]|uniref:CST complex subunit CTC1-like n=1 Tax=Astatotilapia calliptera TaxID=8154 RepID=UPI000E3FE1BD|nr:CST complex subunit CTC1-like [Astatotilapia calliptera]